MAKLSLPQRNGMLPYRQESVEVVVPVYNEQEALPKSIPALCAYLETYFPFRWSVLIADNASTDATLAVAEGLAFADPRVSVLHLEEKGRGRALKAAWLASEADIVAYMDVDLSTNLYSFLPLIAPLASGHSDLAIGSRLLKGAMVTRQWKREVISRGYNLLIKGMFGNGFSDAQCGFKAIKGSVAKALLPLVEDEEWFFDTELLLLAEECELQIYEVPVDWIEDLNSRVEVLPTAIKGVKRLLRVWRGRLRHRFSKRQSREVLNADRHGRLASANSAISLVHESDVLYSSLVRVGPSTNDSSTKKLDPASERDGFGSRGRGQDLLTCEPDPKTEQPGYGQVGATAHLRALIWTGVEEIDANVHYPVDAISNCHEERNQINNTSVTSSIDCQHRC